MPLLIKYITCLLLLFVIGTSYSQDTQEDETPTEQNAPKETITFLNDSIDMASIPLLEPTNPFPNPARVTLLSAVCPGLGQIVNKKYWKLPVIYGSGIFLGFLIDYNQRTYKEFKNALVAEKDNDPRTQSGLVNYGYNENILESRAEKYRRDRDFYIILAIALYGLQILDAMVDAHLVEFKMLKDTFVQITPTTPSIMGGNYNDFNLGVTLALNF